MPSRDTRHLEPVVPVRRRVFGFLWGAAFLAFVAGLLLGWNDVLVAIGVNLFWLTLVAWIFFEIRDRRDRRRSSA